MKMSLIWFFMHNFYSVVKLQEDLEKSQIETDNRALLLSELEKERTSEVSSMRAL